MKRPAFSALLLLAACGGEADAPKESPERSPSSQPPLPELAPPEKSSDEEKHEEQARGAAEVLRLYYERIGAGDYDAALGMREGQANDAERQRFVANFKAYERYRATVGTPSTPATAGEWEYVEVPVMIYGSFRGGKGFGSSGSVTLRRRISGGGWRIFTGERPSRD